MNFLLWLLIVEDIFLLFAICLLLYLREWAYTIVAIITLLILLLTNVVVFQGNYNGFLLVIPTTSLILMVLIARPFASQHPRTTLGIRAGRVLFLLLSFLILFLILIPIVIFFVSPKR